MKKQSIIILLLTVSFSIFAGGYDLDQLDFYRKRYEYSLQLFNFIKKEYTSIYNEQAVKKASGFGVGFSQPSQDAKIPDGMIYSSDLVEKHFGKSFDDASLLDDIKKDKEFQNIALLHERNAQRGRGFGLTPDMKLIVLSQIKEDPGFRAKFIVVHPLQDKYNQIEEAYNFAKKEYEASLENYFKIS